MTFTRRELIASTFAATSFLFGPAHSQTVAPSTTALILVGASWCTVCKQAAPILALLAERRRLPVLVASADARPIAPFPSFVALAGHPVAGEIDRFPTTLVFSSKTQGVIGALEGYRDPAHYVARLSNLLDQAEKLA